MGEGVDDEEDQGHKKARHAENKEEDVAMEVELEEGEIAEKTNEAVTEADIVVIN